MSHPGLKYYVVNLPRCTDRKERISKRLSYHGILDKTTFVDAIDKSSPLIDWFEKSAGPVYVSTRAEHACFLSHLKAIKTFLNDPNSTEGIIFEDDAMPHNNFIEKLNYILEIKRDAPLVMLCSYISGTQGMREIRLGNDNNIKFFTIGPMTYGCQAYWISKKYAQECVNKFDRPLRYISHPRITSEIITQHSLGFGFFPLLVIEEAVYSNIQPEGQMESHRKYYKQFGIQNYSIAEDLDISLLWEKEAKNAKETTEKSK